MSVKPRVLTGPVDMGDVKGITEEVLDEAVALYDLTFNTMLETFAEPLTGVELQQILSALDLQAFGAVVQGDPEAARGMLRMARRN